VIYISLFFLTVYDTYYSLAAGKFGKYIYSGVEGDTKMAKKKKTRRPSNKKRLRAAHTAEKATKKNKTAKKATKAKPAKKPAKGKRGRRYSAKQQNKLLDKYHELRKAGNNAQKASKKVGVSYLTLLKWEKKSGKRIKTKRGRPAGKKTLSKKSALRKALKVPKQKRATKQAGGLTLVTPSGFRIEGITSAELIKVLRGLK